MTTAMKQTAEVPVRKTVRVRASAEKAFRVFTECCDAWWPRTHHIGKSPMKKILIETRRGGRCYTEQADGSECDWGTVLIWEPPRRFVMAWQVTHDWGYEPDVEAASEVEVCFTPEGDDITRVDLEHRYFQRHGTGGATMRTAVDSPEGWSGLLRLFAERAEQRE